MPRFTFLDRVQSQGAARVLHHCFPDATSRYQLLEILADSIDRANAIDPNGWGVTLNRNGLRLNVGRGAALSVGSDALCLTFDDREIDAKGKRRLEREARLEAPGRLKTAPHAAGVILTGHQIESLWPLLSKAHRRFVEEASHGFGGRAPQSPTWREAHSPGVLELLRASLERDVPDPAYARSIAAPPTTPIMPLNAAALLEKAMTSRGLHFSLRHLAAFFTALSSKGFVILSGRSGTGKTALATGFAALLPQPGEGSGTVTAQLAPSEAGKIPLSAAALRYLPALHPGESRAATVVCDGQGYGARLAADGAGGAALLLRGSARRWLLENEGVPLLVEPEWEEETPRPTFRLLKPQKPGGASASNHLFLPVRPDWRDEKPLLGYFNPLANRYEWTPFLRFLLRADAGFRAGDGLAYFVIFDEMNLARVEWYFADLLSVLEAGRDQTGRTREPLRFDFDSKATGELPPREFYLPPNLYFVGTINADETAQPLSPKVLDRAFVLEAPPVDFEAYPPVKGNFTPEAGQKAALGGLFTRDGRFAVPDKGSVAAQLERFPARRDDLSQLNAALETSGTGFGFRVFDEIVQFCAVAAENGLLADESEAFDVAVSLKIAPRLRGARGQVEGALKSLLEWSELRQLPLSASAARRLLAQLEREGFLP